MARQHSLKLSTYDGDFIEVRVHCTGDQALTLAGKFAQLMGETTNGEPSVTVWEVSKTTVVLFDGSTL